MSETVEMNGPLATAGSILNLTINNGTTAPSVVERIKAIRIEPLVTNAVIKVKWSMVKETVIMCVTKIIPNTKEPMTTPWKMPVPISLDKYLVTPLKDNSFLFVDKYRIMTARDCVPVFPDIPKIIGR